MPTEERLLRDRIELATRKNATLEQRMVKLEEGLHARGHKRRTGRDYFHTGTREQSEIEHITANAAALADELDGMTARLRGMQETMHRQDATLQRVCEDAGLEYSRNPYAAPGFDVQPVSGFKGDDLDFSQWEGLHVNTRMMNTQLDRVDVYATHMMRVLDGLEICLVAHRRALAWHANAERAQREEARRRVCSPRKCEAIETRHREHEEMRRRLSGPRRYEVESDTYAARI